MDRYHEEGIVLKSTPYGETGRLLTLFTALEGMKKVLVRRIPQHDGQLKSLVTPLCVGEFVLLKRRSSLELFLEGSVLDLHLPLRASYRALEQAGRMTRSLLQSQYEGRSARPLYRLLHLYLSKLSDVAYPESLAVSFQLKLLLHEGALALHPECSICSAQIISALSPSGPSCDKCADAEAIHLTQEEWPMLCTLACARRFKQLDLPHLVDTLSVKVERLFNLIYH